MQNSSDMIAGLASLLIPGAGQIMQGDIVKGILLFLAAVVLWSIWLGWLIHIVAAYLAANRERFLQKKAKRDADLALKRQPQRNKYYTNKR